jgi:hypothetical protein
MENQPVHLFGCQVLSKHSACCTPRHVLTCGRTTSCVRQNVLSFWALNQFVTTRVTELMKPVPRDTMRVPAETTDCAPASSLSSVNRLSHNLLLGTCTEIRSPIPVFVTIGQQYSGRFT